MCIEPTHLLFGVAERVTFRKEGILAQSLSNGPVALPKRKEPVRDGLVGKLVGSHLVVPSEGVSQEGLYTTMGVEVVA